MLFSKDLLSLLCHELAALHTQHYQLITFYSYIAQMCIYTYIYSFFLSYQAAYIGSTCQLAGTDFFSSLYPACLVLSRPSISFTLEIHAIMLFLVSLIPLYLKSNLYVQCGNWICMWELGRSCMLERKWHCGDGIGGIDVCASHP